MSIQLTRAANVSCLQRTRAGKRPVGQRADRRLVSWSILHVVICKQNSLLIANAGRPTYLYPQNGFHHPQVIIIITDYVNAYHMLLTVTCNADNIHDSKTRTNCKDNFFSASNQHPIQPLYFCSHPRLRLSATSPKFQLDRIT